MGHFNLRQPATLLLIVFTSCYPVSGQETISKQEHEARQLMYKKVGRAFVIACLNQYSRKDRQQNCTCTLAVKTDVPPSPEKYASRISKRAPLYVSKYHPRCANYTVIERIDEAPLFDESPVLKDNGMQYSLKAYAHCLVNAVREVDGDMAVDTYDPRKSKKSKKSRKGKRSTSSSVVE